VNFPNIPVTVKAETLSAEFAAKLGWKFVQALLTIFLPKESETQISVASRTVLALDCSGSTANSLGEKQIYQVMTAGAGNIVELMGDKDEVCVIQFDDRCDEQDVLCEPVVCDNDGKAEARMALKSIMPRGSTVFSAGLSRAAEYLRTTPAGKNKVLIFVSDGENGGGNDPIEMCKQLESEGVTVYTCCINTGAVGNAGEKLLSDMTGGKRFKAAKSPAEVAEYFQTVLRSAQKAAITEAIVEFRPTKFVHDHNGADGKLIPGIECIDMVRKNGTPVGVAGSVITRDGRLVGLVKVDQVGPGDTLEIQLGFNVEVKGFDPNFIKDDRAFGGVYLIGSCTSEGVSNQELARCDMAVTFSTTPSRKQNKRVLAAIGVAAGMRAQMAVQNTTDAAEQRRIIADARQKVQGTMALTGDDPTLQAVLAGLGDTEAETAKGGDAAAKKARSGTQVLNANDADAALAGLE